MFRWVSIALALCSPFVNAQAYVAVPRAEWVSIYIALVNPTLKTGGTGYVGMARRPARADAEAAALRTCEAAALGRGPCVLRDSFNRGCEFFAVGTHPAGRAGFAPGPTPQKAYDACHGLNLNCEKVTYGSCAIAAESPPRDQVVEAPRVRYWYALAFGDSYDSTGGYSATGGASGENRSAAEAKAVSMCEASNPGHGISCRAVGAYDTGCGYIAQGSVGGRRVQMGFGTGTTAQAAYDGYTNAGYNCKTNTVGHCVH